MTAAVLPLVVGGAVYLLRRRFEARARARRIRPVLLVPPVEETAAVIARFRSAVRRFEQLESLHEWVVEKSARERRKSGP